jgi:Fe-S-cluster containining protein
MDKSRQSAATLRLTLGALRIVHPMTVPNATVPATEILPALQGLVNAVVESATNGQSISCRKGCAACCRHLVPLSRTEGERLSQLVEALPTEHREPLLARFAAAEAALESAGLTERQGRSNRELAQAYFALRLDCPFLEDETCSIYPERPLVCREFLVTSPPELCSVSNQEGVTPVAVPKVSIATVGLQDESDDWFLLPQLIAWRRTRSHRTVRRSGPEWMHRFLKRLGAQ